MPLTITATTSVTVEPLTSDTGNQTTPSIGNTASVLIAANANRKGLTIENKTGKTIYGGYADTVTTTDYSFSLPDGSYYEMPASPLYTGGIWGIVNTGTATPMVTEFV